MGDRLVIDSRRSEEDSDSRVGSSIGFGISVTGNLILDSWYSWRRTKVLPESKIKLPVTEILVTEIPNMKG